MSARKNKGLLVTVGLGILGLIFFGSTNLLAASPKGTLKMAFHANLSARWADPSYPSTYTSHVLLYLLHDALLKPMPDGMYSPCLADSWTISPDYRVYEFKLRKGVKFHNGDEMTAEDVLFTFERYNGTSHKTLSDRIEKVEAVNPYLVRVTFKNPFPNFFEYLLPGSSTIAWILPKKYIEKVGETEYRKHPIGLGPYKFIELKPGFRAVGEAYEGFWRKVPHIKRIEIITVKELATRYANVLRGEVDLAYLIKDIFYKKLKEDPSLRLVMAPTAGRWVLNMNAQWDPSSPWSDPRVRKAASLAIDRVTFAAVHLPGGKPIGSLGLPGDPENLDLPADPYDLERAKKLMAEAGYPNGFHGGKFYPQGGFFPMGEHIANDWKRIGISCDLQLLDRPSWTSYRRTGKMKGAIFIEGMGQMTIGGRLEYLFGGSFSYGNYPDIEALWNQYNKAVNPKARKDLIARIQRLISDKTMFIPLVNMSHPTAVGPRVKGNPYKIHPPKSCPIYWTAPFEDIELND